MAIINDREYEWADLTLILAGRDLARFRGLKYSEKIEREAVYAKGRNPVSIQSGNLAYEGEIKMLQSEYEALVQAGNGSILSLSLDALCCYGNPLDGDAMLIDRIESLRFTEAPKELNQGDKFAEITLPFIALRIRNQI
ncbi:MULTISPECIES: hypothetical protein [Chryseobacterium]|uniref:Uncharacterized protein n=1 Tax=Chryseobacterium koreense CCUG 49689 TaxID=1304281 RepID=A0A0J7IWH5_9FLAO|nr:MULTISPECIES: hypothetical protein [Chryseobacterium]KMQ70312.1 hypothetical protein ACM44_12905 [Chryseobacterium koreense CCUG 49689]MBB5334480.1 hypothetical protein [Chryseobacterium koreense]